MNRNFFVARENYRANYITAVKRCTLVRFTFLDKFTGLQADSMDI